MRAKPRGPGRKGDDGNFPQPEKIAGNHELRDLVELPDPAREIQQRVRTHVDIII